jgi:hypothetical protein
MLRHCIERLKGCEEDPENHQSEVFRTASFPFSFPAGSIPYRVSSQINTLAGPQSVLQTATMQLSLVFTAFHLAAFSRDFTSPPPPFPLFLSRTTAYAEPSLISDVNGLKGNFTSLGNLLDGLSSVSGNQITDPLRPCAPRREVRQ